MRFLLHSVAVGIAAMAAPAAAQDYAPANPLCIAPANPGGGWDLTCRAVSRLLGELEIVNSTMQVRNMPGAGGGVAFAHTVAQQANNSDLLVAASGGTTLLLSKGDLPDLEYTDVRWVGALGADFPVLAVRKDSEFDSLETLLDRLREDPRSVVLGGGSSVGGTDHIRPLQLARAAGVEDVANLRYISFEAGTAVTELLGGRSHVFTAGISEIAGQYEAGTVRILAVMAPERLPGAYADIPTARELGYDVVAPNWRGFYAPIGMSDDAYQFWIEALQQIEASDGWADVRQQNGLAPLRMFGEEFSDYVVEEVEVFREFSAALGLSE